MLEVALATYVAGARPIDFDPLVGTRVLRPNIELSQPSYSPWQQSVAATSVSNDDFALANPSSATDALGRLRQFFMWHENWDGEGAPQPDRGALDTAVSLLSLLQAHHKSFGVSLDADSRPTFFLRDSEWEGEIVVDDSATISFDFRRGNEIICDYEVVFGSSLPEPLTKALLSI